MCAVKTAQLAAITKRSPVVSAKEAPGVALAGMDRCRSFPVRISRTLTATASPTTWKPPPVLTRTTPIARLPYPTGWSLTGPSMKRKVRSWEIHPARVLRATSSGSAPMMPHLGYRARLVERCDWTVQTTTSLSPGPLP